MTSQTFTTAGHTFVDHTLSAAMLTVCQDDPADFRLVFDHTPEGLRDLYALLQTPAAQTLIASAAPPASALTDIRSDMIEARYGAPEE